MPIFLDIPGSDRAGEQAPENSVTIGLINNMPDPAVDATERQFIDLLRDAAHDIDVQLKLFAIPEIPRSDEMRRELTERYRDVAELWETPLDGLIVTGTEPRAANLKQEPYWEVLAAIVEWARDNTSSTIWSCLAAHAAVLHLDGITRSPLKAKQFGIFECEKGADHPMTAQVRWPLRVPHSRFNDLRGRTLASCGYTILSQSPIAGVDMFAKLDRSYFLYFQGHPEYEPVTLLREYRRDISRFLKRERRVYPAMPEGFFTAGKASAAAAFRQRAITDRREELIGDFPVGQLEAGLRSTWRPSAISIYEKWLGFLHARKAEGRKLVAPLRRTWRDWPVGAPRPLADPPAR